jgi:hypothetical protein
LICPSIMARPMAFFAGGDSFPGLLIHQSQTCVSSTIISMHPTIHRSASRDRRTAPPCFAAL